MKPTARPRSVPLEQWPAADQEAWKRALKSAPLFGGSGPAAHLAGSTREDRTYGYGRWIGHLGIHHPPHLDLAPASRVTIGTVTEYIERLEAETTATGVYIYVRALYDMMRVMVPEVDWSWLKEIKGQLGKEWHPRSKASRVVPAADLYKLGIGLMKGADAIPESGYLYREIEFRDGMICAILIATLIRRRNLTSIRIDEHLNAIGDEYILDFISGETKNRRSLEFRIPGPLVPYLERYLIEVRPRFPAADSHDGLWPSMKGNPMSGSAIFQRVAKRTKAAFGHPIGLHLFRHCAATSIAIEQPQDVLITKDLLGNWSYSVTESHYNLAQQVDAARSYHAILTDIRCDLDGEPVVRSNRHGRA